MPKLLQICVEGNTGSTGTIAELIGKIALNSGWESYIAFGRFPRESSSKLIKIGTYWDIFLHGIETRIFDRHGLGSRGATKKLIKEIIQISPDIIHLHHLHGYYINIEILFKFLSENNISVVWTFHDCWSITGHCAYFDYIGCDKWKRECNNCPQMKEYPSSIFIDRSKNNFYLKKSLFNSVDNLTVVSVSNWLNDIVGKSFMKKLSRKVIYNGIDVELFKPSSSNKIREKFSIESKFLIFGLATTWSRRKGLDDFIELSKNIDENAIIILVGLNTSQIKSLPKNIIGLQRTENQQELVDFYVASDVFLNLSVEETFGLTTAEALSCGTPAIVYNATASPELIDSQTGIIVEKNNIKGLLLAIEVIKKNGKSFYTEYCRSRAVKYFDKNIRYKEYFDLYNEKLNTIKNVKK
ncbi:glycosyltransferase [Flavobacterium sp. XS2P14]|uniref:glycosyltransferase n=1 Tax=Flavobacterium sp. XS2P14 TaxID=3401735 RepID=UPI003AAF8568